LASPYFFWADGGGRIIGTVKPRDIKSLSVGIGFTEFSYTYVQILFSWGTNGANLKKLALLVLLEEHLAPALLLY
jgi:hypothetical protein